MIVKFKKLHPDAIIPTKATKGSACYDVYSAENYLLQKDRIVSVSTQLALEIPSGYFVEIRPRSSLAKDGVILLNAPATIDSDYRGEIKILLQSLHYDYPISTGNRIAQLRLVKEEPIGFSETQELSATERGAGGFGSTGK